MKAYFETILDNNLQSLIDTYVNGSQGDAQGALEGWIWGEYRTENAIPPWQQDYIATALGGMVQHGNEKADVLLTWMDNFLSGRFINEANGFSPLNGAAYDLVVINPATGQPYQTWAEASQATWGGGTPTGMIDGSYPDWAGGYAANAKASLAAVISATQSSDAIEAYGFLQSETTSMLPSYSSDPTWNLSPMLAEDKYLTNDEVKVHTGTNGTTMTAAAGVEQMLIGGSGNDTITGSSGINMLFGMDGNDTIIAGSGDAYLYGGDGDDRLVAGAGNDSLKGGTGRDIFAFTANAHATITDFKSADDRIEIYGVNASDVKVTGSGGSTVIDLGSSGRITVAGATIAQNALNISYT